MNKIFLPFSFLLFSCTPKEGGIYPEVFQAGALEVLIVKERKRFQNPPKNLHPVRIVMTVQTMTVILLLIAWILIVFLIPIAWSIKTTTDIQQPVIVMIWIPVSTHQQLIFPMIISIKIVMVSIVQMQAARSLTNLPVSLSKNPHKIHQDPFQDFWNCPSSTMSLLIFHRME